MGRKIFTLEDRLIIAKDKLDIARGNKDGLQASLMEDEMNHLLDRIIIMKKQQGVSSNVHHV